MIQSRNDLIHYLEMDRLALGKTKKKPSLLGDEIWKFQRIYRKYEFCCNTKSKYNLIRLLTKYRFHKLSIKLGFTIPINTIGPGLSIAHYGTIVINSNASIGKNLRIQEGVTIGATSGSHKAPHIGNNVFIGSGAKLIGEILISNDTAIGAGSVVTKTFLEEGITIAGIPAKKISNNNSHKNLNPNIIPYL